MILSYCICFFVLSSLAVSNQENISNPVLDLEEKTKSNFGDVIYKALNEDGLNERKINEKPKRVRMTDVPYFDILNRNREFRRQIISPSQLPRQPKERWEQRKVAKQQYSTDKSIFEHEKQDESNNSVKRAKQLHYYGPEFLKLLGISYLSKTIPEKDVENENGLMSSRSLKEIKLEESSENREDEKTEAPELSVPSPVPISTSNPIQSENNDEEKSEDGKKNNKKKMKEKETNQSNTEANRYSYPAFAQYTHPYSLYSSGHHPGLVSSGIINPYQQQLVGVGPTIQNTFVPGVIGTTGNIGSVSGVTHVPVNPGNSYQQTYPLSYNNYGHHSSNLVTSPTFGTVGFASSAAISGPGLGNSGFPNSQSIATPHIGNSGFSNSASSTYSNSGISSSSYPIGNGFTSNAFSVPYYGNPHGRTATEIVESRKKKKKKGSKKKGSTSVKKVVGGALAAGAGLALLGAISNSNRPHYGHYPSSYPSQYPAIATPSFPTHGHSPYPVPAQGAYPTYTQPAVPAQGAYPTYSRPAVPAHGAFPTSISYPQPGFPSYASSPHQHGYGGYRPGYPFGRSQEISLEKFYRNEFESRTLSINNNIALTKSKNEDENENNASLDEEQKDGDLDAEQTMPTSNLIDENGVILYPAVIHAPAEAIPSTQTYFLPNVNRYQLSDGYYNAELIPIKPYQTQVLPIHLDEYPFRFVNFRPEHREKRNADKTETNISNTTELNANETKNISMTEVINSSKQTASEMNNTLSNIRLDKTLEEYKPPVDIISPDYTMRVTRKDEKSFKNDISQTLLSERQNKERKKPSRGSLLAAGLLGAAAGYAVTNAGINSYHNRPQYYGGNLYGAPQYPNPYLGHHPNVYHGITSIGRPTFNPRPVLARPPISPYAVPARPPISRPYYYPFYRSITSNNEENELPLQSKGVNETRSPFIILSTHLEPAQTPNRFPYNQQFYYQQHHHTINQQQSDHNSVQPQILLPNRFIYVYDQPFIQNQAQPAAHESEMTIDQ